MRARHPLLLAVLALAALFGCKKTPPAENPKVTVEEGPGALPPDHPQVDLPATSRGARRLSVDQLLTSVYYVANPDDGYPDGGLGITWKFQFNAPMLKTMGRPDFIFVTEEDLTPSTLYMKFVSDIANDVCGQMVNANHRSEVLMKDVTTADTLQSNPAAVKAHLRWLQLRYFGKHVADDDDATIQPMADLFDAVVKAAKAPDAGISATNAVVEGWRAVCVASFTSPQFHIY